MDPRRLREETRTEHEATEALMPLGAEGLTPEVYVRTLRVLLSLAVSWERWAEGAAPADLEAMVRARRRSDLLRRDLRVLTGVEAREEQVEVPWGEVTGWRESAKGGSPKDRERGRAAFLGALYVMEGSTLGGRFLAKHVEGQLGLEPGQGDAYFQGHGERTGALWKEVTAELSAVPEEQSPVVIEAARRTFRAFGAVLQNGVPAG